MEKYLSGFISPGIAPLALVALGMWIWAEFKMDVKLRLFYGALAILLCIATVEGVRFYGQSYERMYVRNSLNVMKEEIRKGNIQLTLDAIDKFESTETARGFSSAASGLWQEFGAIQYQRNQQETSKKDATDQKTAR